MKKFEFEQIAKDSNLRPLERVKVRGVDVCIAEGARRPDEEMEVPYWHTAFGIGLDEDMDTCQRIKIPMYVKMPSGIEVRVEPSDRLNIVKDAALEWIKVNEEGGRYVGR